MNEFGLIEKYLQPLSGAEALDLKDDAAVWSAPPDKDIVISTDTLVEGIHFPRGKIDAAIAHKLLAVNVSDLTAKGADLEGYFLNLTLPESLSRENLLEFCGGLLNLQEEYGLKLWGGDTTKTPNACVLSLTMIGTVPRAKTVLRSGAQPGDVLAVTGTIGDGYLGLQIVQQNDVGNLGEASVQFLKDAYHLPDPPYELRHLLRKYATAALDISDGLVADAGHMAKASNVGLEINLHDIPISNAGQKWLSTLENQIQGTIDLATGGDDYEVLASIPKKNWNYFKADAKKLDISVTQIGLVYEGEGVIVLNDDGEEISIKNAGYTHF